MALWDRIKESASTMQTQLVAKKNDLKSGAFRDASMAMCALVAAADGSVDPSERQRVAQLIATNEVLQNFDADDLRRRFDDNLNKLTADFAFGKVSVLQEIAKAKKKPAEARAVIQIGIVIGGADGDFDKTEQAVVREACFALDLPPHEFDLVVPRRPPAASPAVGRGRSFGSGGAGALRVPPHDPDDTPQGRVKWLRRRVTTACATSRTPSPDRRCRTTASGWRAARPSGRSDRPGP